MIETLNAEARRLRDEIYITEKHPAIPDDNWAQIAEKWIEDISWLRRTAAKQKDKDWTPNQ